LSIVNGHLLFVIGQSSVATNSATTGHAVNLLPEFCI
jgi:hypothetical protein